MDDLLLFRHRFLMLLTLTRLWVCFFASSANESEEKRLDGVADTLPLGMGRSA
jgi:hypothetical protein